MNFKKGHLYRIKTGRGRPLWADGPWYKYREDFSILNVPEGGIVLLVETYGKNKEGQNWIKVVFEDKVGFLLHGFLTLEDLLEDIFPERGEL